MIVFPFEPPAPPSTIFNAVPEVRAPTTFALIVVPVFKTALLPVVTMFPNVDELFNVVVIVDVADVVTTPVLVNVFAPKATVVPAADVNAPAIVAAQVMLRVPAFTVVVPV